uniref:uncharacterized protein LOC122610714 n=1 Tax=Erigeron canadensis TaxID=72917 RepID=UPI001CB94F49|nr:uncharacterized protein LOC122610714 [Erigeron canadensis]
MTNNNNAIKACWLVMLSMGVGVARWNGPVKALYHNEKRKIISSYNKHNTNIVDHHHHHHHRSTRSVTLGSELATRKYRSRKTQAESMKKVMDMNCFGPSTLKF